MVAPRELRVMSWNLWYGGTKVDDHRAKQLKVIAETGADVVGLQETYGTSAQELAEALGWHHHRPARTSASSAATRSPPATATRTSASTAAPECGSGSTRGQEVDVWSAHLDYTPYGPYEARFDGLPAAELIAHEGVRLEQMREILRRISESATEAVPVVLVGDFNAPSHLDWPDVEWPVTKAAEEAGLRDSTARPTPIRYGSPDTPGRRSTPSTRTAAGGRSRRTGSTSCCTGG